MRKSRKGRRAPECAAEDVRIAWSAQPTDPRTYCFLSGSTACDTVRRKKTITTRSRPVFSNGSRAMLEECRFDTADLVCERFMESSICGLSFTEPFDAAPFPVGRLRPPIAVLSVL